jgi:hypothetical protein
MVRGLGGSPAPAVHPARALLAAVTRALGSASCSPFDPQAAAISASNLVCIAAIPAAILVANSPSRATIRETKSDAWVGVRPVS